jgi:hypothetical protein
MKHNHLMLGTLAICGAIFLAPLPAIAHEHAEGPELRGTQSLDVYSDGATLHLLRAEFDENSRASQLLYQRSADGGKNWSAPVRVDSGLAPAKNPRRGADPQIAATGENLVAVWTTAGSGFGEAGPMAVALSSDGGKNWQAGPNPADDRSTQGHGYIDVAADAHGVFHLVWLDNRDGKQGLRYARSADDGWHWSKNVTLDPETCECCWNTLLTAPNDGVFVLYRDKNPRDMALTASEDGGESWLRTGSVGSFHWHFPNCPESGAGLGFTLRPNGTETLHALVRTGKAGSAGIYYQSSTDGGRYWSAPRELAPGVSDHPDLAADASGNVIAAWDALDGDDLAIMATVSHDGGRTWSHASRLSKSGVNASHPRAVATSGGLRVFWTYAAKDRVSHWASGTCDK